MAIDFRGMCKGCIRAIEAARPRRCFAVCTACKAELRQGEDEARTWAVVPKEQASA